MVMPMLLPVEKDGGDCCYAHGVADVGFYCRKGCGTCPMKAEARGFFCLLGPRRLRRYSGSGLAVSDTEVPAAL